jgi:CheY-like chemotaxis protein
LVSEAHPEVAIIDNGLPGIDGYEVARRVRELEGEPAIVLIALTGYGEREARERAARAGFDAHVTKPASPEKLDEVIEGFFAARSDGRSTEAT